MNKLAITLIELDNQEAPNIGTIISSIGSDEELKNKAIEALSSHFDAEIGYVEIEGGLGFSDVRNSAPLDAVVYLSEEEVKYYIEIQQTFIY